MAGGLGPEICQCDRSNKGSSSSLPREVRVTRQNNLKIQYSTKPLTTVVTALNEESNVNLSFKLIYYDDKINFCIFLINKMIAQEP